MMRALITGAGGFCGQHLSRYLSNQGVEVHTLSYRRSREPRSHHVPDVTDVKALATSLKRVRPNYVFHLAGASHAADPILFYRVNTQYAVGLLDALEKIGLGDCPVLLVGTSAEYGMISHGQLPICEDLPPRPYNHYGISKLAQTLAGLAAHRNGRPVAIVRPFNVIGSGMPEHLVVQSFAIQVVKILNGKIPPVIKVGNLKSSRDFVDVNDTVKIYWQLLQTQSAYGEVINVCSGKGTVIGDLLSMLIKLSGVSIEMQPDPSRFKPIDIPVHYGSVKKLRRILGYVPRTSLEVTLKRILEEMKRQL